LGDAERNSLGDDGDAGDGGGVGKRRHGAHEHDEGLGEIDDLASGGAVLGEGRGEGSEGGRGKVAEVDLAVVGVVGGDVAAASYHHAQSVVGAQEGGKGLRHEQVQAGGEGASLPDARMPKDACGLHTIGVDRGPSVVEEDAGPVDHARGSAHLEHDAEQEVPIHRVKGLGEVEVHVGGV
jgi:hypothetical protein